MTAALLLATALSVADYATMPQLSSPVWSPDGKQIAYVVTKADLPRSVYDSDVWLINADGSANRRLTFDEANDSRPRWSPDGTSIAFLSDRGGKDAIHLIELRGGESRQLVRQPTAIRSFEWSPDGKRMAFVRADEPSAEETRRIKDKEDVRVIGADSKYARIYTFDISSGKSQRLTSGAFSVFSFDWSPDGRTIVFDRARELGLDASYETDLYTISSSGGDQKPLVVRAGPDQAPQFSPDGKFVSFRSANGSGDWLIEQSVNVVPSAGGSPRSITSAHDRSPESVGWSADSRTLYFSSPMNLSTRAYSVGLDGGGVRSLTAADRLSGDASFHGGRVASISQSLTDAPELYVDGRRLTDHNAAFRGREVGSTRVVRWKNPKDGLEIEGLLTLPVGYKGGPVPLLTFVHGGPASRFDLGFLGYLGSLYAPQALAAKGFAIFRPNPRGTGGYGEKFRAANRNDWAAMPWLDVTSGIDQLVTEGVADPKRMGLMGWSYGGYLAAWAAGHSDRFRAISIGAPVTELMSLSGTSDTRQFIPYYYPGMPFELLRAQSPLFNLKKTSAKILIQHGGADDPVPLSQGTMLYRALEELGADVTMVIYPRSAHVPREPKQRIDAAQRNLDFFVKNVLN